MSDYTVTSDNTPSPETLQAALLQPLSTLVSKLIETMLASGELALIDGVIVPGQPGIILPTEASIEL